MDEPIVICTVCGARMRQERRRCLRCGMDLPARKDAPSSAAKGPPWLATKKTWILVAISVVVLIAAGTVGLRQRGQTRLGTPAGAADSTTAGKATADGPGATSRATPERASIRAVSADPQQVARVAYDKGDYQAAFDGYKQAIDRNPNDADSQSNCGQALVRLGRVAEAVPYFERAVRLNDGRWAFHFNLAHASGLLNQWDRAVEEYGAAQRLFPDDYATEYNLGTALHKRGDEAAAIEHFRRAVELRPSEAEFHLSLAMASERVGRSADAVGEYSRYLELAPDSAEAAKVRARIAALAGAEARK